MSHAATAIKLALDKCYQRHGYTSLTASVFESRARMVLSGKPLSPMALQAFVSDLRHWLSTP